MIEQIEQAKGKCPNEVNAVQAAKAKRDDLLAKQSEAEAALERLKAKHGVKATRTEIVEGVEVEIETDERSKQMAALSSAISQIVRRVQQADEDIRTAEICLSLAAKQHLLPLVEELDQRFYKLGDEAKALSEDLDKLWRAYGSAGIDPEAHMSVHCQFFKGMLDRFHQSYLFSPDYKPQRKEAA